ncbi:MAG: hypothetical protein QOE31_2471, partial [Solirubrobacteraceae bacterium]|nr:hypothetical protein [Solirubrobacteraceae bacterium]
MQRTLWNALVVSALLAAAPATASATKTAITYDDFDAPGYDAADYAAKWSNTYGPGELAAGGTQSFAGGQETVAAAPFRTAFDFSVFDHIKYIAVSNQTFPVPRAGSVAFASTMTASTPGIVHAKTISGTYTATGAPYSATLLDSQQAGVVMNVVDFCTGQLFDWFLTDKVAAPLIERLPTNVTGNTANPGCPGATYVGRDKMYTQFIKEIPVRPGPHRMAITFQREPSGTSSVTYQLDGRPVAKVHNVGIPLDRQGVPYTGVYPSLGPGEQLGSQINSLSLGHGLFSVLDPFPFQHPDAPELAVSIPLSQRIYGQGAIGTWDDFTVT